MSLKYIIDEVCEKCGYDSTDDRELLLRVINRACKEVYEKTDLPGCLREITVLASADNIIALPYYVGELRNARSHYTMQRLQLVEMAARYAFNPWPQLWNNWRVLKKSPLQNCIENSSLPIVISMADVDTVDVTITVIGQTITANRFSEVVTIHAGETSVSLTSEFIDIFSITKNVANNRDITFTGADETGAELILAVIPNDRVNSLYTLVDVSKLPLGGDMGTSFNYIDVLYKEPLPYLSVDGDEFICSGFDDAISAKVCEYFFSEKADGSQKAIDYYNKCNQIIIQRIEHTNGATEKEMVFAPNGLMGLYPRYAYKGGYRRLGLFR
jgi:hypothetical protein